MPPRPISCSIRNRSGSTIWSPAAMVIAPGPQESGAAEAGIGVGSCRTPDRKLSQVIAEVSGQDVDHEAAGGGKGSPRGLIGVGQGQGGRGSSGRRGDQVPVHGIK